MKGYFMGGILDRKVIDLPDGTTEWIAPVMPKPIATSFFHRQKPQDAVLETHKYHRHVLVAGYSTWYIFSRSVDAATPVMLLMNSYFAERRRRNGDR